MKNLLLIIFCICSTGTAIRAQNVRFVYGGDEDKPHGTQVISVNEKVKPNDRPRIDKMFGRCFVTNEKTYDAVISFIQNCGYTVARTTGVADTLRSWIRNGYAFYKIIGSDGSAVYLCEKYWTVFFDGLRADLRAKNLDLRVLQDL